MELLLWRETEVWPYRQGHVGLAFCPIHVLHLKGRAAPFLGGVEVTVSASLPHPSLNFRGSGQVGPGCPSIFLCFSLSSSLPCPRVSHPLPSSPHLASSRIFSLLTPLLLCPLLLLSLFFPHSYRLRLPVWLSGSPCFLLPPSLGLPQTWRSGLLSRLVSRGLPFLSFYSSRAHTSCCYGRE